MLPLLVAICAGAFWAPGAFAGGSGPSCSPQPESLSSAHFTVTYSSDSTDSSAITSVQAGQLLAGAELAYATFQQMGFPAPAQSGGKTYINVYDLSAFGISAAYCADGFDYNSGDIGGDLQNYYLDRDVFGAIETGYGSIAGWLDNAVGAWAGWKALGYPANSTADPGPYDMSLDCQASFSIDTDETCATAGDEDDGQSRWPFVEYLAEKYGASFVGTVLTDVNAAGGDAVAGLQNALASEGTNLSTEYGNYAAKLLTGGWSALVLDTSVPPLSGTAIETGAATGAIPAQTFGVDHLATRFIEIDRGDGSASHACYAATLTLNVTIPAGVTSQPVFFWNAAGNAAVPLTVSGNTATATLPWDTCLWSKTHGYLALPNTSTTVNGSNFVVSGSLSVSTTEVTATPPSLPANNYANGSPVTTGPDVPKLSLRGPATMQIPAGMKSVQVLVASSTQGSVHALLGSTDLGTKAIVTGQNLLSFAVPDAVSDMLTLTPVASDGKTTGTALTVKLVPLPGQTQRDVKRMKSNHAKRRTRTK